MLLIYIILITITYFFMYIILSIIRFRHELYIIWLYIKPFLTWRIIVCYLPFWFLATGWAWVFSVIGKGWFRGVAIGWLTFLWMPWCPEKLITIPLAIWLHTKIFPNHSTPHILNKHLEEEKSKFKKVLEKLKKTFSKKL